MELMTFAYSLRPNQAQLRLRRSVPECDIYWLQTALSNVSKAIKETVRSRNWSTFAIVCLSVSKCKFKEQVMTEVVKQIKHNNAIC